MIDMSSTVRSAVQKTAEQFREAEISSALLDAELLLGHILQKPKSWLLAHSEELLNESQFSELERLVKRRLSREPIAYLTGHKEFYGRDFIVTKDVLIPRPETEDLIDLAKELLAAKPDTKHVVDIGTGSGCIGVTLKLEKSHLDVTLSDVSHDALEVTRQNAEKLKADVYFAKSDLLSAFITHQQKFDMIVANLPYVSRSWETSPETDFEPSIALYADNDGLAMIAQLIFQIPTTLNSGGYLLLEADPEQFPAITELCRKNGLEHVETRGYAVAFQRQRTN